MYTSVVITGQIITGSDLKTIHYGVSTVYCSLQMCMYLRNKHYNLAVNAQTAPRLAGWHAGIFFPPQRYHTRNLIMI